MNLHNRGRILISIALVSYDDNLFFAFAQNVAVTSVWHFPTKESAKQKRTPQIPESVPSLREGTNAVGDRVEELLTKVTRRETSKSILRPQGAYEEVLKLHHEMLVAHAWATSLPTSVAGEAEKGALFVTRRLGPTKR